MLIENNQSQLISVTQYTVCVLITFNNDPDEDVRGLQNIAHEIQIHFNFVTVCLGSFK